MNLDYVKGTIGFGELSIEEYGTTEADSLREGVVKLTDSEDDGITSWFDEKEGTAIYTDDDFNFVVIGEDKKEVWGRINELI